ncbi:Undecaprenyl-phosphate galactose phosphotransferase, WbaP/exopolysaccharide biosynthesis polyprenyl glycosylphosphotransferase [Propionibacterium cyclohexanicum]|uniref:Undecaprenyl-phosphate galactose phosphotransferase, WbaP/exopolysaccharide biosynthesis polyprenyl glycosylphosphotransferase n=1 Tax=Propionibacterium cyclohexanicum TaxID=64702 RepID=A0A1H9TAK8_9ACTN|nr:sugar transferase [Propionibacterium cyclohexanicum]SER94340.1 Undecaprenyl-phosphate galactose phosphotransferase, WbaP/exopolysaccharide biosynthesis polyprenyl glycosylphosphotransferase [Propionibacterium cyclohexanicum]
MFIPAPRGKNPAVGGTQQRSRVWDPPQGIHAMTMRRRRRRSAAPRGGPAPGYCDVTRRYAAAVSLVDTICLIACTIVAVELRLLLPFFDPPTQIAEVVAPFGLIILAAWLAALWWRGAYDTGQMGSGAQEFVRVAQASMLTAGTLGITAYLFRYPLPRGFFVVLFAIGIPALILERIALRELLKALRRRGLFRRRVLLGGDEAHMLDLHTVLSRESWLGLDVVGTLPSGTLTRPEFVELPRFGSPAECLAAVRATRASLVIFAEGSFERASQFSLLARQLEHESAQLVVVPALTDISAQRMTVQSLAGVPLVFIERPRAREARAWLKRGFDIVGASMLLLLASPIMAATALAIRMGDGGPVIYQQRRVGMGGTTFEFLKFRSMVVDADALRVNLTASNEASGALFKIHHDPRITPVGRIIRRYSIDELPQLVNVLRGEMSLVGPRPALESEVSRYEEHVNRRLAVPPGLTGLWQVSGRSDLSWEDAVRLDLYYVDNWSFTSDVTILLRTLRAVLSRDGAY